MRSSSLSSVAAWLRLCGLIVMAIPGAASGLKAPTQLGELDEADRKALETIAGHSETLRDAVLKASLHVDALVETQRIQEQSSASFQERIDKLDKKQQEQMWDVVREPGLLEELATEETPSRSQLDEIAKRHPEALAPAIHAFGAKQHDLLVDVAAIHNRARDRFDVVLSDLDEDTQQAFRKLVDEPELMSVLVRRVNLVVRLGDSYRKNPKTTRSYLSALAEDVAKRDAASAKEWQKRVEDDPKAKAELEESSRAYADENGYDYDELTRPEVRNRVVVVVNPYPFWFGYPIWYSDLYLYPYGYWYPYAPYFGYYHYYDHFVYFGLPSLAFMQWFYIGHHHHHYAYLSNCFTNYYHDYHYAPTYYNVTANNFVRNSDPIDHHRADGSGGGAGRPAGNAVNAGYAGRTSYADRDRGFMFNRYRPEDRFPQSDRRRHAPGERGPSIDEQRGGGLERGNGRTRDNRGEFRSQQPRQDGGAVAGDARAHGRAAGGRSQSVGRRGHGDSQSHETPGFQSPQSERVTSRGRGHDRSERDQPRFLQRPDSQPQPSQVEPRAHGRESVSRGGAAPQVNRQDSAPAPSFERPSARGGGSQVRIHRGGGSRGGDAPQGNRDQPAAPIDAPAPSFGGGQSSTRGDGGGHDGGSSGGGGGGNRGDHGSRGGGSGGGWGRGDNGGFGGNGGGGGGGRPDGNWGGRGR